ncbi:hypothetical protein L0Y65_01730 [Candidatus Micrarchaeota archaeon]|nr:hypothetical protein [Candidatus Micrarchaeota archaeon]
MTKTAGLKGRGPGHKGHKHVKGKCVHKGGARHSTHKSSTHHKTKGSKHHK